MINAGKVRLMAELNLYEKTNGRKVLKLNKEKKRLRTTEGIKNVIFGIITYLLLAFIVVAVKYEVLIEVYENIGIGISLGVILAGMVVFVIIYFFFAKYMILLKYEKVKGNLWKYNNKRKKLRDIIFNETQEKEIAEVSAER